MQDQGHSLINRPDTFFGICQAIGDDIGFSPNLLRIAFGFGTFFSPLASLGVYGALGIVVFASRLIFPEPRVAIADKMEEEEMLNDVQPLAAAA